MQLNTHSAPISPQVSQHNLSLMQYGRIKNEVQSQIKPDKSYFVVDISSDGGNIQKQYSGLEIRANYPHIFGNWLRGFKVYEIGNNIPVFTYRGPIADIVFSIVSPPTFH